ncbi:taste receptor type 1 member 3-like [Pleurodeles waltl]|uniref:taste receptor type 1 member 3-like n=1 Tax=Pleurodeles waltl TaxID=8319 RepID=UPI003709614E
MARQSSLAWVVRARASFDTFVVQKEGSVLSWWLLTVFILLLFTWACNGVESSTIRMATQFTLPGDFVIGGLFSVHSKVFDLQDETLQGPPSCTSFNAAGYRLLLAMRFAIEQINNSSHLLPNITLGYDIHDTCSDNLVAMRSALLFATTHPIGGLGVEIRCNYTEYMPRVLAVIGPGSSEICIVLARIFSFFGIPQISYSASNEILNDKARFPSFFRTVPSDKSQVYAITQLVNHFRWNWVAALGTDDEYGRKGIESFTEMVLTTDICIAYQAFLPIRFSETETHQRLTMIVDGLLHSRVNVTVLFASETHLAPLIEALIERNVTEKVWIASADWSTATSIARITNISSLGNVIGFAFKSGKIDGFEEYVKCTLADRGSEMSDTSLSGASDKQRCPECDSLTLANISTLLDSNLFRKTFSTYTAVYSIAHALHKLLQCNTNSHQCDKDFQIYPWQLLVELEKANITIGSQPVYFSKDGDLPVGYDLIMWNWRGRGRVPDFRVVGKYDAMENSLQINGDGIHWFTGSDECQPGQMKRVKDYNSCCYECEDCPAGFFQNISDDPQKCTPCPTHQWSDEKSTECQERTLEYPRWEDAASILVAILTVLGLLLTAAIAIIFIRNRHTPAVHSAGCLPSLLMLFSLACVFCSFYFFIGEPSLLQCRIRQPLFSGSFAVCLSVLLSKSLKLSGMSPPRTCLCSPSYMYVSVLMSLCMQVGLCFSWYFWNPPVVVQNPNISASTLVVECQEGSLTGFGLLIIHNCLLAITCFMLNFLGRTPSKAYPTNRNITFSMLIYFIAWAFFIPVHVTSKGKNVPFFQVGSGLISVFGILVAYFMPRCYIIMCRPEFNMHLYFQSFRPETLSTPGVTTSSDLVPKE